MALCTGVLTSDLFARWAQKEGGRARWKGSWSSLDGIPLGIKNDLKSCGSYSISAGTVPLQVDHKSLWAIEMPLATTSFTIPVCVLSIASLYWEPDNKTFCNLTTLIIDVSHKPHEDLVPLGKCRSIQRKVWLMKLNASCEVWFHIKAEMWTEVLMRQWVSFTKQIESEHFLWMTHTMHPLKHTVCSYYVTLAMWTHCFKVLKKLSE